MKTNKNYFFLIFTLILISCKDESSFSFKNPLEASPEEITVQDQSETQQQDQNGKQQQDQNGNNCLDTPLNCDPKLPYILFVNHQKSTLPLSQIYSDVRPSKIFFIGL